MIYAFAVSWHKGVLETHPTILRFFPSKITYPSLPSYESGAQVPPLGLLSALLRIWGPGPYLRTLTWTNP